MNINEFNHLKIGDEVYSAHNSKCLVRVADIDRMKGRILVDKSGSWRDFRKVKIAKSEESYHETVIRGTPDAFLIPIRALKKYGYEKSVIILTVSTYDNHLVCRNADLYKYTYVLPVRQCVSIVRYMVQEHELEREKIGNDLCVYSIPETIIKYFKI